MSISDIYGVLELGSGIRGIFCLIPFIMTYESIFFCTHCKYLEQLAYSVVDACTVNAFKARLDKFWKHQSVKFDFTADLTGTGNRSEKVIK